MRGQSHEVSERTALLERAGPLRLEVPEMSEGQKGNWHPAITFPRMQAESHNKGSADCESIESSRGEKTMHKQGALTDLHTSKGHHLEDLEASTLTPVSPILHAEQAGSRSHEGFEPARRGCAHKSSIPSFRSTKASKVHSKRYQLHQLQQL